MVSRIPDFIGCWSRLKSPRSTAHVHTSIVKAQEAELFRLQHDDVEADDEDEDDDDGDDARIIK